MTQLTLNNLSHQITTHYPAETSKDKVSDSYEFTGEVLGKGGFGLVHEGKDRKTGSPVAIKTQARTLLAQTEASMSKTLKLSHVVCCREIFEDPSEAVHSKVYIVMDLVPGKNIKEAFLKSEEGKSLAFNDIIYITHQSLEFLSELFRKKMGYFDFKPENLMYTARQ